MMLGSPPALLCWAAVLAQLGPGSAHPLQELLGPEPRLGPGSVIRLNGNSGGDGNGKGTEGAVASESAICSDIGAEVIEAGVRFPRRSPGLRRGER